MTEKSSKLTMDRSTALHLNEKSVTKTGRCCGTFGELLQGYLPTKPHHFLVTLPIARYSTATFTSVPGSNRITVLPAYKWKAHQLAKTITQFWGTDRGGILSIYSEIEEGKGCGSSSADMVATALALQHAFNSTISNEKLAKLMAHIEPTDGIMYTGIVAFNHRTGVLRNNLGTLPLLTIVSVDEGGAVDTVEFNKSKKIYSLETQLEYQSLLLQLEKAIRIQDLKSIGQIATRSAILNQSILPKAQLDFMLDLQARYQTLGIVVAHSGTKIGLLLDPTQEAYPQCLQNIINELQQQSHSVSVYHTVV